MNTIEPPRSPEEGYHLSEDLVDHAIEFMHGYVAERGNYLGVAAPTHAKLTEIVKKVERQEIKAAPALLGG